jgi:hypothetical protein
MGTEQWWCKLKLWFLRFDLKMIRKLSSSQKQFKSQIYIHSWGGGGKKQRGGGERGGGRENLYNIYRVHLLNKRYIHYM